MESYRTFVGTEMSQHLKSYRTYFPQFLSKSGGLTIETGNWHWNPLDSSAQILSYLIFVITEVKKPMSLTRIELRTLCKTTRTQVHYTTRPFVA